ncbi:MAG: adenosylcobinamide-GDP ribazoletransferase [Clostridium sp.]|nr:adenosylcobinamide-GDP ribazoletransferase [Clostridium sp.]
MIQSCIVAFSMYSKIPMPKIAWDKKSLRYALCFFPLVGAVIGAVMYLAYIFMEYAQFGNLFMACILTLIPVLITGGIHLDGYLDTIDALSSYADREKKLEILKDSNSGAFAIIYGMVYFIACIAVWSEWDKSLLPYLCISYVMSRTVSAFSVASFPLAKNTGLAATFQDAAHKRTVRIVMAVYFVILAAALCIMDIRYGAAVILINLAAFALHYRICKNTFGGITGDLAGFFLQICELAVSFGLMVLYRLCH